MEGPTDMKHISAEVTEGDSLEERIKVIEEKLNILIEQFNNFMVQHTTVSSLSEESKAPTNPVPTEYDYDDWYTTHGQGD